MKARTFIITILLEIIVLSFTSIKQPLNEKNQQKPDFSGKWKWENNNNYSTFSLDLKQVGNNINGYHCAICQNGNRIDCWGIDDDEYSIKGRIKDGVATVIIKSYFSDSVEEDTGVATIKFITTNKIEWRVIKDTKGQNYFPDRAILMRE